MNYKPLRGLVAFIDADKRQKDRKTETKKRTKVPVPRVVSDPTACASQLKYTQLSDTLFRGLIYTYYPENCSPFSLFSFFIGQVLFINRPFVSRVIS